MRRGFETELQVQILAEYKAHGTWVAEAAMATESTPTPCTAGRSWLAIL